MKFSTFLSLGALCALLAIPTHAARPIGFARSTNLMVDYREDAMSEAQIFYAPEHWFSVGLGYSELTTDISAKHSITYARLNLLAKRWNMENAQANIFGWGGVGNIYVGPYDTLIDGVPDATPAVDTVTVADWDLLRYPFDADGVNAGGLAPDYRAIIGTGSYVAGRYGSAVKFDGSTTGGMRIPGVDTLFTQGNQWTIALWFHEDSVVKNTMLFELRGTDADGNDRGWETYHGAYPDATLNTCSAAGCASFAAPVGVWHNIVYRYAAPSISVGGPLEIWLDGALVATLPNANNVPLMTHVSPELRLGYYGPYGSSGQYGKFTVDELRVFDRVFTPAEQCTVVSYGTWNGSSCTVTGM